MTDNEIIKALECCSDTANKSCKEKKCPAIKECMTDVDILEKSALYLINRQKAEIERLEKEQKALLLTIERARKERVRIQTILVNFMDEIYVFGNKNNVDTNSFAQIAILGSERDSAVKQIKSEAYKDFAERLKGQYADYDNNVGAVGKFTLYKDIDNLVKELTESKNDLEE